MSKATSIVAMMNSGFIAPAANLIINGYPERIDPTFGTITATILNADTVTATTINFSVASITNLGVEAITGTDSNLNITGLASTSGGAVSIVGGTSSTAATAGGSATITGGTPGVTGTGGAARIEGGPGGATSGAGGVASLLGGDATTSGTGGAAIIIGGDGAATSNGGAATLTGGVSGAGATGNGGAASLTGGAAASTNGTGGSGRIAGGAGTGTGAGGVTSVTGGASGAGATGNGGAATVTGGAALSTDGVGGSVTITSGASTGTGSGANIILAPGAVVSGSEGMVATRATRVLKQAVPTAQTVSATLTAAAIRGGIVTGNQGGAAAASYQLPTGADLTAGLPSGFTNDDSFDFSVINLSTDAAEDITLTTNTGWTLQGSMVVESNDSDRARSSGLFRVRRTAANTFTIYRIA